MTQAIRDHEILNSRRRLKMSICLPGRPLASGCGQWWRFGGQELSEFGRHWVRLRWRREAASPTRTRRNCGRSIRAASGATKSNFTPPITTDGAYACGHSQFDLDGARQTGKRRDYRACAKFYGRPSQTAILPRSP